MGNHLVLCASDQQLLFQASERGNVELAQRLLSKRGTHKASINVKDKSGSTSLHRAAEAGHGGVVRLLLERGAATEICTDLGLTPLCLAAKNGHEKVVQILVNAGASIETADAAYGCTPLLWAVQNGGPGLVNFLVSRGADVECRSRFGYTALIYAAQGGSVNHSSHGSGHSGSASAASLEKVQILLSAGADPSAKDMRGATAAQHARQRNNRAIAELLEAAVDDPQGVALRCAKELSASSSAFSGGSLTGAGGSPVSSAYRRDGGGLSSASTSSSGTESVFIGSPLGSIGGRGGA